VPPSPRAEPQRGASRVIPDDFDPFADPVPAKSPTEPLPDDVLGMGLGSSGVGQNEKIDELFDLQSGQDADPFKPGNPFSSFAEPLTGAESVDPLVAIGAAPPPRPPPYGTQRDDAPEIHGSFRVPRMKPAPEPPAPVSEPPPAADHEPQAAPLGEAQMRPSPPRAPPVPEARAEPPPVFAPRSALPDDRAALLHAFLTGAGVPDVHIPGGLTPELMNLLGQLFRETTQGTLDLLLARATAKRQLRADVTMIVARENNPLKFSPTADAALTHLLAPQGRGFMTPLRAVRDAYNDLRSHEVGFIAGMRAALAGLLARFSPAQLEQRLTSKTMLDSILPMNRQAKLWELFEQLYADISREAEDNFHSLFGKEFMRAYEEQIARLEDEERKRDTG
jgi:FHA domain-containing protein